MLLETVTDVRVSVPALSIPPPSAFAPAVIGATNPSVTVRLEIDALAPAPTSRTRLAPFPLIAKSPAPGPVIVVEPLVSVTDSCPCVSVIVCWLVPGNRLDAKVIESAPAFALASAIACRNVNCPAGGLAESDNVLTTYDDSSHRVSSISDRIFRFEPPPDLRKPRVRFMRSSKK